MTESNPDQCQGTILIRPLGVKDYQNWVDELETYREKEGLKNEFQTLG